MGKCNLSQIVVFVVAVHYYSHFGNVCWGYTRKRYIFERIMDRNYGSLQGLFDFLYFVQQYVYQRGVYMVKLHIL